MKKFNLALIASLVLCSNVNAQTLILKTDTAMKTLSTSTINKVISATSTQPDLITTITTIEKSGNFYTIKFTTKNQGGGTVDISKVTMQGNIYTGTGNFITAGGFRNLGVSGTLTAGQEVQGVITCTVNSALYENENYLYRVTTDNQNTIAESNESNNLSQSTFKGHIVTSGVLKPKQGLNKLLSGNVPDLVIEVINIASTPSNPLAFTATYKIKNIGNGRIDLKEYSVQGSIREESITVYTPCGGHSLVYEGIILEAGGEFTGTRGLSANIMAGKGYKYKIDVKLTGLSTDNPESNAANNSFEKFFVAGN